MNSKLSFSCFSVLIFTFFAFLYNPGLLSDGNGSERPEGLSQGGCTTKAPQGRRPLPKSLRFKSTTSVAHHISATLCEVWHLLQLRPPCNPKIKNREIIMDDQKKLLYLHSYE
ncbi:hypothetical protein Premu_0869 [Hallella multisaccharivorax DSM 17128]|uniref:Uncharacterized protein n=1 Tax=Hallella multisaccharivorax DSM 17128 TaxID=688246 RepID=F8N730_9BACT|nr:hypothetical protein Premu_0869 [Hallella multisaccharivorax DSM 17128]